MTEHGLTNQEIGEFHHTAQRLVTSLREIQAAAHRGHALNALYEHVAPDMRGSADDKFTLLRIAQPTVEQTAKLIEHGIINQDHIDAQTIIST